MNTENFVCISHFSIMLLPLILFSVIILIT
jgi:hypothetical protein